MLKQSPSGDLEVLAAVEGVKGVAEGLSALDPPAGELGVTWAAEIGRVAGGVFLVRGARQLAAVVRWLGRSSGSPASTAAAAGVVVRGRERGHKCWSKRRTGYPTRVC